MKRRKSADQRIMDRAREARMDRIARKGAKGEGSMYGSYSKNGDIRKNGGGRGMIKVTRLNGEVLYLNVLQIESIESIPETKIKMMDGYYFLVKDSADSIMDQIRAFIHSCIVYDDAKE